MKEKLLVKFKLPNIEKLNTIEGICAIGYRETGNKFSVAFHGSKGYLSNLEISCEGNQISDNIILIENLKNKNRSLKNVMVSVFYSEQNGIRLSTVDERPTTEPTSPEPFTKP